MTNTPVLIMLEKLQFYIVRILLFFVGIGVLVSILVIFDFFTGRDYSTLTNSLWNIFGLLPFAMPFLYGFGVLLLINSILIKTYYIKKPEHKGIKAPVLKTIGVLFLIVLLSILIEVGVRYFTLDGNIPCGLNGNYCAVIIEYHAAIEVYEMPGIKAEIDTYSTDEAWVSPLNYAYVEDKDFINRILPLYTDINIHCIIRVHLPNGDRFFLEDGDVEHHFIEVSEQDFLTSLNQASKDDVETFWSNFRPGVRTISNRSLESISEQQYHRSFE